MAHVPTSLLSDLSDIAGCEAQAYMAALDDVLTRIAAVEIPIKEQNSPREITDKTASEDDIHGRLRCVSWPCVSLRDLSTRSRLRPLRLSGHQFEMRVRLCRTTSQGMAHCS